MNESMATRNTVLSILRWFQAARPKPNNKSTNVQVGVHFEEVSEMLAELSSIDSETTLLIAKAKLANHELAEHLKNNSSEELFAVLKVDRKNYLDALCDQIVTAIGSAHEESMDIAGGLSEVAASNWSKFDENGNPIFDENGKIAKGPNYFKADLSKFV